MEKYNYIIGKGTALDCFFSDRLPIKWIKSENFSFAQFISTIESSSVGMAGFAVRPEIFFHYHLPGRILIAIGYIVLCGLTVTFYMLIAKPNILERICEFFLRLGRRLHLVRYENKKRERRVSQITVTLLVYLAIGGNAEKASDIWFTQSFATIGTYSVPIPGGMGVADYLLLDGFRAFLNEADAVNLELIGRGVSFYICMIVSAFTVLIGIICTIKRRDHR